MARGRWPPLTVLHPPHLPHRGRAAAERLQSCKCTNLAPAWLQTPVQGHG